MRDGRSPAGRSRPIGAEQGLVAAVVAIRVRLKVSAFRTDAAGESPSQSQILACLLAVATARNAAEHGSAAGMVMRNPVDGAVNGAAPASIRAALLIAPILVFLRLAFPQPMDPAFGSLEASTLPLALAPAIVAVPDAESNWPPRAFLLFVYAAFGVAFFLH